MKLGSKWWCQVVLVVVEGHSEAGRNRVGAAKQLQ